MTLIRVRSRAQTIETVKDPLCTGNVPRQLKNKDNSLKKKIYNVNIKYKTRLR